jgi:hypothetical protein
MKSAPKPDGSNLMILRNLRNLIEHTLKPAERSLIGADCGEHSIDVRLHTVLVINHGMADFRATGAR